jgi:hypothetical protein
MLLSGLIIIFWFIAENEAWELIEDIGTAGNMYRGGSVYCEKRDSMIFFAGSYADQNRKSFLVEDMREYIFTSSSWNVIHEQSNTSCPSRYGFSFNPLVSTENGVCQALVIGGVISSGDEDLDTPDAWLLTLNGSMPAAWEKIEISLSSNSFPSRFGHQTVYRKLSDDFLVFGGGYLNGRNSIQLLAPQIWRFKLGGMNQTSILVNATTDPNITAGATITTVSQTVYKRNPSMWNRLEVSGNFPTPRAFHVAVLNDEETQLYVHGGLGDGGNEAIVLLDLWMYSFEFKNWTSIVGSNVARYYHSAWIDSGRLFFYGGVAPSTGNFNPTSDGLFVTELVPSTQSNKLLRDGPYCTASNGGVSVWCKARNPPSIPDDRTWFYYIVRNHFFYVYGGLTSIGAGKFNPLSDFWKLNLTDVVQQLDVAQTDDPPSILPQTFFFMVGILCSVIICLALVLVNIRRRGLTGRTTQYFVPPQNRARALGARATFIQALPLKTYKKNHDEAETEEHKEARKKSIRLKLGESQRSLLGENEAAPDSTIVISNSEPNEIAQDELHNLCAICLTDYEDGEQLRVLPCSHFFHPGCIDVWLLKTNACPMCKAKVDPEPVAAIDDFPAPTTINPVGAIPNQQAQPGASDNGVAMVDLSGSRADGRSEQREAQSHPPPAQGSIV